MRDTLAERLLAEVMSWGPEDVARERPVLQAMAVYKYDGYQQYSPGMRFVESLAMWLEQFEFMEDRIHAYEFVKRRLIFFSDVEMAHLVSVAFSDFIRPFLLCQCASRLGIPAWFVNKVAHSKEYKVLRRQSLFLALSDGAHIDLFRRSSPEISNEQIRPSYEVTSERIKDMLVHLHSDLVQLDTKFTEEESKFRLLFLLDDFSGSGLSYLRYESENSEYAGKIHGVLSNLMTHSSMGSLFNLDDVHVCIVLYIATKQAISRLNQYISDWLTEHKCTFRYTVLPIQVLPDVIHLNSISDARFLTLLEKYFDDTVVDRHFKRGQCSRPWLGFDECALPLVLSHNTPNNSLPLLWFENDRKWRGLFPRVRRHKES